MQFTRSFIIRAHIIEKHHQHKWEHLMKSPILTRGKMIEDLHSNVQQEIEQGRYLKTIVDFQILLDELCRDDPDPIDPLVYAKRLSELYSKTN